MSPRKFNNLRYRGLTERPKRLEYRLHPKKGIIVNNYRITIIIGTLDTQKAINPEYLATTTFERKDVETPHPVSLVVGDLVFDFVFEDGMVYFIKGEDETREPVYALAYDLRPSQQAYTPLTEDESHVAFLDVERIYDQAPEHPKGYRCGDCAYFDAEEGRKMMNRHNAEFTNGSYGLLEIVVKYTAQDARAGTITPATAGHCTIYSSLVDRLSPACPDHYQPRHGPIRRAINKLFSKKD